MLSRSLTQVRVRSGDKIARLCCCDSGSSGGPASESCRLRHGDGATMGQPLPEGASVDYPPPIPSSPADERHLAFESHGRLAHSDVFFPRILAHGRRERGRNRDMEDVHVGCEMPRFRVRAWIECGRRRHGNRRPPDSRSDLATLKPSPANPKARSAIDPGSGMVGTIGTVG